MFHRRYGLKALVWTIALVVCSLAMRQYVAADETIVVRRGDQVHDVVISTDMTNQVQRWDDLHDRVVAAVTTYVVANKGYTSYIPNFCFRYQSDEIQDALANAFDRAGSDIAMRRRGAKLLNYFGDSRGVDWALQQVEQETNPERLRMLTGFFTDLFYCQKKTSVPPRRFDFTPGIERLVAANLRHQKFDIRSWINCIEGDEFPSKLRRWLDAGDLNWRVGISALDELASRSPEDWQLDYCLADINASKEDARLTNSFYNHVKIFQRLSRLDDSDLQANALAAYEQQLLNEKEPLWQFRNGCYAGVVFSERLLLQLREMMHRTVRIDTESAVDDPGDPRVIGMDDQLGWKRFRSDELGRVFQGTADAKVLAELRSRLVAKESIDQQARFDGSFQNVNELMAMRMVSKEPLSAELLEYLSDTKSAIARMEYHCQVNQKTPEDLFRLFHAHGFATELDHAEMKRRLAQQIRMTGAIHGRRELLGAPADVGMFELARGVFLEKDGWAYASHGRYVETFWRLVDATGGEFDPSNFTVVEGETIGKRMVGFTWHGKSFYFPFTGVTGFIPPLNAILRHEGSKNRFAEVMGRPTGGFLTASTPKIAFAPVDVFEGLESDFGLTIVGQ